MKKLNRIISPILIIISLLMTECVCVFAETDRTGETAQITIDISDRSEEGSEETSQETSEEDTTEEGAETEDHADGDSEKSKAAPTERMDITEMTEVRIGSYKSWCEFAKNCTLDTWSADKYVVLTDNIDFNMKDFKPIPYFAGVFDGKGYTINKAAFTSEQNYIGVFSKTAPTAVIRNLNVIGVMKPSGRPFNVGGIVGLNHGLIAQCKYDGYVEGNDYIGGIAGYNEATGIITACQISGKISGLHYVGGICGTNTGLITGCSSKADINTVTKEEQTRISDIKVEEVFTSLLNLGREEGNKKTIKNSTNPVDIGGIAGHNTGEISSCANESTVGYEHVGYNIGGIAGRQSGYIHDCNNFGKVYGRKDVGGIVGQAEPYIRLDLTKDIISQLNTNINSLHDSIDKTIKDTDSSSGVVSARLNVIKDFADRALNDTGYLADNTTDFVNGVVGTTNELVGRIEYVLDETAADDGPMDKISDAGEKLKNTAGEIEEAVEDLDIYKYMNDDEKTRYDSAKENLKNATSEYAGYFKPKYDEVYPDQYDRKYYQRLRGDEDMPVDRPTAEQIEQAEEQARADGKTDEEIAIIKKDAQIYAVAIAESESEAYADDKYRAAHNGRDYSADMESYSETIADAVLDHGDEIIDNVEEDSKDAVKNAKKMANDLKSAGSRMRDILKNVASRENVQFPQLSEEYKLRTSSLVNNIQGMSDNLGFLNSEMHGSTETVCRDLEDVNDQFSTIMLLFTDAMDGVLDMDYSKVFEDESNDVCETSVDATIAGCENLGIVAGDIDTGGIAGTMAQEYDFDLEGDITGVKDAAKNSTYRTKCVLRADTNRGEITGKKSYVGGVCGLHEIGTILRCRNFGKVASQDGDYVGGIAGRSYATIRNCHEKGILAGEEYIGGIAGEATEITDSIAMPTITGGTGFMGAIAGYADDGARIKGNGFVSDTLAGIDRISKSGVAEPISYKDVVGMEETPPDYSIIKASFIIDGKEVASVEKKEGEIVSPSEAPVEEDMENKGLVTLEDDEYIDWDCDEEIVVDHDIEINGEIVRYATTIASDQTRENKQSLFLVDGKFRKEEKLVVTSVAGAPAGYDEYVLLIPKDENITHRIRYQYPEGARVKVYVKNGDSYEEVAVDVDDDYYCHFEASGNQVFLRVKTDSDDMYRLYMIIGCAVSAATVIAIIIGIVIKMRKNKRKKKEIENSKKTD